jgi:hypothetical protein
MRATIVNLAKIACGYFRGRGASKKRGFCSLLKAAVHSRQAPQFVPRKYRPTFTKQNRQSIPWPDPRTKATPFARGRKVRENAEGHFRQSSERVGFEPTNTR